MTAIVLLSDTVVQAQDAVLIDQWGFVGGRTGGWKIAVGDSGEVTISGDTLNRNWAAVRGGFVEAITPKTDAPLVVTGVLEFEGAGFETWSGLRYGIFRHDSVGTLASSGTDSARWTGKETEAYGYLFTPRSGANDHVSRASGGAGTQGVIKGGSWLSTYGGVYNHQSLGVIPQSPRHVMATAGVYDFGISIRPLREGSNELKFFLVEKNYRYWYGGICVDTSQTTTSFNGVCFAVNYNNPDMRALQIRDIEIGTGELTPPPRPPRFYVDTWGIVGNRFGGWKLRPGDMVGNVTLSGSAPNTGWVAVRGGFFDPIMPSLGEALVVTGKIELVGGGFETANSFRFGIFDSDSAGWLMYSPGDSTHWSGTEDHHSGYLCIPPSGTNSPAAWGGFEQPGTLGAVVDGVWLSPGDNDNYVLGADLQMPANAVASAGVYDFAISVAPQATGGNEVSIFLIKDDASYAFRSKTIDNHVSVATDKFNGVAFALDAGNSTTAMNLYDVLVEVQASPVSVKSPEILPAEFALSQNYPNPFNPSTRIGYSVPKNGYVSLKVYNLLGEEAAMLFAGVRQPGNYEATFDGGRMASGVYVYQLQSVNGSISKKLVLMK